MPYGNQYVYTPPPSTAVVYPQEYVYAPAYGWRWVAAPWVWGTGPRIYFSAGPRYYGWYHGPRYAHRGYVRSPVYRPWVRGYAGGRFGGGRLGVRFGHR
jgi:hypothetical protein